VTKLVQDWVRDGTTNGGVTLIDGSAPVYFAEGLGGMSGDPAMAPFLDVTYGPSSAKPTVYNPGARNIYGLSSGGTDPAFNTTCVSYPACAGGTMGTAMVRYLGAGFVRFGFNLRCSDAGRGQRYRAGQDGKWDSLYRLLQDLYGSTNHKYRVIPIIQFGNNPTCPAGHADWGPQLTDFIHYLHAVNKGAYWRAGSQGQFRIPSPLPMTYFEIGNEVDNTTENKPPLYDNYPLQYATAARALVNGLNNRDDFRVLTAGMESPTSYYDPTVCQLPASYQQNVRIAVDALTKATAYGVPANRMAVGVHPYSYNTNDPRYWRNFGRIYHQNYILPRGVCLDLGLMIHIWSGDSQYASEPRFPANTRDQLPIVFSEINWRSSLNDHDLNCPLYTTYTRDAHRYAWIQQYQTLNGPSVRAVLEPRSREVGCEGSYLIDLFTWMHDRYRSYVENPQTSRLVVGWFEGSDGSGDVITGMLSNRAVLKLDTIHNLGLYYVSGGETLAGIPSDGGPSHYIHPTQIHEPIHGRRPTNIDFQHYPHGFTYSHDPKEYDKVVYIPHCSDTLVTNSLSRKHPTTTIANAFMRLLKTGCYDTNDKV